MIKFLSVIVTSFTLGICTALVGTSLLKTVGFATNGFAWVVMAILSGALVTGLYTVPAINTFFGNTNGNNAGSKGNAA